MVFVKKFRLLLRNSSFLHKWCRPFCLWLMLDVFKWKQRLIKKYGAEVLFLIHDSAKKTQLNYYADYGTLLGLVREKGFIKHDVDMDFSILSEENNLLDFYLELEKQGFYFERFLLLDNRLREFSMRYKEISIDFFIRYFTEDRKSLYVVADKKDDFWPVFIHPAPLDLIEYDVLGGKTFIPSNFDEMLTSMYGNWRVPVVKWEDSMAPKYQKDKNPHPEYLSRDREEWILYLRDKYGDTVR